MKEKKDKPVNTYKIDDSFYRKLDEFTEKVLSDGFDLFKDEFANVAPYIEKAKKESSGRDDKSFRTTPKAMYLLEALYYNIIDKVYREQFNKAKETVIILPDCLSLRKEKCERIRKRLGKVCMHCAPACQISKIMKFAEPYGIDGYFSKRKLTEQLTRIKKQKGGDLAVIGISCVLTLASGVRSAREAGIPARGVFLNFTGCEHWSEKPFVTETIIERVKDIIREKYGIRDKTD